MTYPMKTEKLSEKVVFLIPPSIRDLRNEAEKCGLDFPDFARLVLKRELEKFLQTKKI